MVHWNLKCRALFIGTGWGQRRDAGSFAWTALGLTRGEAAESSIIVRWRGTVHDVIADVMLTCGGRLSAASDRDTWQRPMLASPLWWWHVARRTLAKLTSQILTRGERRMLAGPAQAGRRDAQGFSVTTLKWQFCPFCPVLSSFVHFAPNLSPMLPKLYLSVK